MTICYKLTRVEIVQSYFRSLRVAPKFLAVILLYSLGLGVLSLLMSGAFARGLAGADLLRALLWAMGAFLFLPFWLFLRGKTAERTLSISERGISTAIGNLTADVPWSKVRLVKDAGRHVLIASVAGNAFLVPSRAFENTAERSRFLSLVEEWRRGV